MITVIAALLFVTVTQHEIPGEYAKIYWYKLDDGQCHYEPRHHEATVPRLKFASRIATKRANEIIESEARDRAGFGMDKDETPPDGCTKNNSHPDQFTGGSVHCEATYATDDFVSILCGVGSMGTHTYGYSQQLNLLVDGDRVELLSKIDELFASGSDYKPLLQGEEEWGKLESATFDDLGLELTFHRGDKTIPWDIVLKYLRPEIAAAYTKHGP